MWDVVRSSQEHLNQLICHKSSILHCAAPTEFQSPGISSWMTQRSHSPSPDGWNSHSWDGNENFKRPLDLAQKRQGGPENWNRKASLIIQKLVPIMIHQVDDHYKIIMEVDYSVVYHHVSHFTHDCLGVNPQFLITQRWLISLYIP
jgi:hypothetical protein